MEDDGVRREVVALPRPTPNVQPEEDQHSPRDYQTDAQSLTDLPHTVLGKGEPRHDEAGQGRDVHAEEDVLGEHRPYPFVCRGRVLPSGADIIAFAGVRHRVCCSALSLVPERSRSCG